jgi:tetratricopeptide (TPR) repeat protein
VCAVAVVSSRAEAQSQSSYNDLIRGALTEFEAHNYAEARALFERAHALQPSARTLRGLGVTAFELKRYVEAVHELEAALVDKRKPLTEAQRKEVPDLIARARHFVGTVKIEVTPDEASVVVDGEAAADHDLMLDLGTHQVLVQAPGYRDVELKVVIDGGEDTIKHVELSRLSLEVTPETTAAAPAQDNSAELTRTDRDQVDDSGGSIFGKWWFWTAAGVVITGAAVGTALALSGDGGGSQPLYRGNARSVNGP